MRREGRDRTWDRLKTVALIARGIHFPARIDQMRARHHSIDSHRIKLDDREPSFLCRLMREVDSASYARDGAKPA
jgi:hypothetical protein